MERNSPKIQPTDHISTGVEYSCNQNMIDQTENQEKQVKNSQQASNKFVISGLQSLLIAVIFNMHTVISLVICDIGLGFNLEHSTTSDGTVYLVHGTSHCHSSLSGAWHQSLPQ
jgi:hypothetical protein